METVKLKVEKRDPAIKAKDYRKDSKVILEYYGKDVENIGMVADYQEFRRAFAKSGKSTMLELELGDKSLNVLVHDVDYHPVTDEYIMIDVVHVDLNKEVTTKVPLEFVGTSLAVKDEQGTLMTSLDALEVKCLAKDLLHSLEVDISGLVDFNSAIKVSDIKVPEGITVITDLDELVATVIAPKEEEEEPIVAEGVEGEEGEGGEGEEGEGGEGEEGEGGEEKKEGE
jgi:large subunit ribosomal protein L25